MLIKSLQIKGMLSLQDVSLDLRPLNVLIGPNASGKSNLIEVIALLQSLPRDLASFVRESGGIGDWLWKGNNSTNGTSHIESGYVEVILECARLQGCHYAMPLDICERAQRLDIVEERLENERPDHSWQNDPYRYFQVREGRGMIRAHLDDEGIRTRSIHSDDLTPGQSVLHEIRDPTLNPEITSVRRQFDQVRLYREWNMGGKAP